MISMDGRGRALDNVFIERLCCSLKYELIYPGDFGTGLELFSALENYFHSTITRVRVRRSAAETRQICFRTNSKGRGRCHDGTCPPNPLGFIAFAFQNGCFFLHCIWHLPYNRNAS
jgi:hypothetical protein